MFERFNDAARKVMALAQSEARRLNHDYVGPEHILLGVVSEAVGLEAKTLGFVGLRLNNVRLEVERLAPPGPDLLLLGSLPLTPSALVVVRHASEEAGRLNHSDVGTLHLLLALVREPNGVVAQALKNLSVKVDELRQAELELPGPSMV